MSISAGSLWRPLKLVSEAGAAYGLERHLGKFQLLTVRCQCAGVTFEAGVIEPQSNLMYLGSLISDDGRVGAELQKRLGIANGDFRKLSRI